MAEESVEDLLPIADMDEDEVAVGGNELPFPCAELCLQKIPPLVDRPHRAADMLLVGEGGEGGGLGNEAGVKRLANLLERGGHALVGKAVANAETGKALRL